MTQIATLLAGVVGCSGATLRADEPLTLDQALAEARAQNARLPAPRLDVEIAREHLNEARAERWLKVAIDGDVIYAPAYGYDANVSNLGEVRLQVTGQQPLLDGGARKAQVRKSLAEQAAAGAHYRMAQKDVDLEVRSRMAELAGARDEVRVREEGVEQLRGYLTSLESRQAAGQGIAADILKTRVRVASEETDKEEAAERLADARLELNDLMGRDPASPLEIAPLPDPAAVAPATGSPWLDSPEVAAARADAESAEAGLAVTRAERSPHLTAAADAGLWGSDTSSPNLWERLGHDFGYSLTLSVNWPLFDLGGFRARVAQSTLGLKQAQQAEEVERRHARLEWHQAHESLLNASRKIEILSKALPEARDSTLATESRYLGGAATALDVLEAHAAAVDTAVRLSQATMQYRVAQALEVRWGSP
jgi:outer membrane protein TolC